jgi:hypothetical protein
MLLEVKHTTPKPTKEGKRRTLNEMKMFKEWQKKEIERKFQKDNITVVLNEKEKERKKIAKEKKTTFQPQNT